ncbi:MAG: hypothetical protein ACOX1P_18495 [Thermoguttaceae bacterium]
MWVVQLAGDTSDLAALAQSLTENDINISHDGQDYVLMSDQFTEGDDANAVHQKAEGLAAVINGASRLALDAINSIRVGAVYRRREDGRRDIFVFPEPIVIRFRAFAPTMKLTHANGTVEESHPAEPVKQWARVALKNDAVGKVFRILAGGALDWMNLYRILEVVASDVGGLDAIDTNGWATKASMRLFKHTANSPGVLGLDARHGAEKTHPPKQPMAISEARALVNSIVHAWLRSKCP